MINDSSENIYLLPNDLVVLDREPQSVVVLGAANRNAQVPFGKADLTLAEAMGNAGGLTDIQADPSGVFVLRYETPAVVASMKNVNALTEVNNPTPHALMPVIYRINMKHLEGLFAAQAFKLEDRDLIYVANADAVQLNKLIRLLSAVASIFNRSAVVSN